MYRKAVKAFLAGMVFVAGGFLAAGESCMAAAASGSCGSGLTWSLTSGGTMTIQGTGAMDEYGEDDDDFDVPWYEYKDDIKTLIVMDGVTSVSSYTFWACDNLEIVGIGNDVEVIGEGAFYDCDSLASVSLGSSLTELAEGAFDDCEALTEIELPDALITIGAYAFDNCSSLAEVSIGENLEYIGEYAFCNCSELTELTLPRTLTFVGEGAFSGCELMEEIHFRGSAPEMEDLIFEDNEMTAYYPASDESWTDEVMLQYGGTVEWLPEGVEYELENGVLTIIRWDRDIEYDSEEEIPWYEERSTIKKIVIEEDVEHLGNYAFQNCLNVSAIWFEGDGPSFGGSHVFFNVNATAYYMGESIWWESALQNYGGKIGWTRWSISEDTEDDISGYRLRIYGEGEMENFTNHLDDAPWYQYRESICWLDIEDITVIGAYAFYNYTSLVSVTLDDALTEIGTAAFRASSLEMVNIPENVETVSESAFRNCTSLEIVTFEGSAPELGDDIFWGMDADVYCDGTDESWTEEILENAYGGDDIRWHAWTWELDGGVLRIWGKGEMDDYEKAADSPWYADKSSVKEIVVEGSVTRIGNKAFPDCTKATEVTIGDSVREIGEHAFVNCVKVKTVSIGDGLESIELEAFDDLGRKANRGGGAKIYFAGDAPEIEESAFGAYDANNATYFDLYYDADTEGWNSVVAADYGNDLLSWIYTDDAGLFPEESTWSFNNSGTYFGNSGYYITSADLKILKDSLTASEYAAVTETTEERSYGIFGLRKKEVTVSLYNENGTGTDYFAWGGSCYGMSVMTALTYRGKAFTLLAGNGGIAAIDSGSTPISDNLMSLINFYQFQQLIPYATSQKATYMQRSQINQLEQLEILVQKGETTRISLQFENGGHAILGYALEMGEFHVKVNGNNYVFDRRIITYDPNQFYDYDGDYSEGDLNYSTSAIYYSLDTSSATYGDWAIPCYGAYSSSNGIVSGSDTDNACFGIALNDANYLNSVDYETGTKNITVQIDNAIMRSSADSFSVSSSSGSIWQVEGGMFDGENVIGSDAVIVYDDDSYDGGGNFQLAFSDLDASYTVTPDADTLSATMYYPGIFAAAAADMPGAATFTSKGGISVAATESGTAALELTSDEGISALEWSKVTVYAEETAELSLEPTDEGVIITGDNLNTVTVVTEGDDGDTELDCSSGEDTILLTSDGDETSVYEDRDGDGEYESQIAVSDGGNGTGGADSTGSTGDAVSTECTHEYGSWQTVSTATVFAAETQSRTCTKCGEIQTRTVGEKLTPTMKLNVSSIPLQIRQSTTAVKVTGLAAGDSVVSWKSSNSRIVKVSKNGKITAGKKTGKATVTVTLASGMSKKVKVTVQKKKVQTKKITGVPKKIKLNKGKSIQLEAVLNPITSQQKLSWKSSNTSVASVSSKGKIVAKKKGQAIITVKSGSKTIRCKVTVK